MEIRRVVPSGYCKGVVNAIKLAKDTKLKYPNEKIYVLGMIVHNSYVTKELDNLGIITLDDTNKSKSDLIDEVNEGIIIFTAHGISDELKQKVINKGLKYVDATCVDVLKTKETIINYLNLGYDVIYFGKKNHPEADAIISINNKIHLVSNENDISELNINNELIFMTNQTTMSYLELNKLIQKAKNKYPTLIIEEEICNATSSRQLAISNLENCDLLYVVGDVKSNNTNKLVEIGIKKGIKTVKLIPSYKQIEDLDLIDVNNICVTAGTSTPPQLIDEVINYLKTK